LLHDGQGESRCSLFTEDVTVAKKKAKKKAAKKGGKKKAAKKKR
jgi:hypothetical protein